MDRPKRITRTGIAAAASVFGATALVIGGLLLLLGGLSAAVLACVVAGAAGIGLWMAWSPGEFQAWMSGRQTQYGTTSLLITILFIGFLVYAYVLVDRANITADLTSIRRYSLNRPTLDTIDQLRERGFRVRIVGFFTHDTLREQESADLLLRQYEAEGGDTIEVEYIDPDEQPDLAARYNYQADLDGQFVLAVLGPDGSPRTREIILEDGQTGSVYFTILLGEANERGITTGLKTVASAGRFKVYFTTGHRERSLDLIDDNGISRLGGSLEGLGIIAAPLALADVTAVPDDASAVLIVGAWDDFTEAEVQVLAAYLQRGGRLGIFADPPQVEAAVLGAEGNTFLQPDGPLFNYLWDEFGVRLEDAMVIETQSDLINVNEWGPIINTIAPHSIMADVRDEPIYTRYTRPITLTGQPDERQSGYTVSPLLYTSPDSFAEADIDAFLNESRIEYDPDGGDVPGRLIVGVTVQRHLEFQQEIQPRLLIVGDSDLLKNEYVSQIPGNVFFWTDAVDWLTGFADVVTFAPVSDPTLLNLSVSRQERNTIALITMVVLPGVILAAGAAVWWYRRR